jgi:peptidoglycan-associated lipoprotein
MRYKGLLIAGLVLVLFAGCECPSRKARVKKTEVAEKEKTSAVALVTPEKKTTVVKPAVVKPSEKGKATPQQIAKAIKDEPIPIKKTPEGKIFKAPESISPQAVQTFRNINFDFDRYDIRPDAREILNGVGKYLLANPKTEIMIEGHCDERGTREYNLVLGEQRALSTRKFLVGLGVAPDRLHTVSYGKDKPFDPRSNEDAWAKNRRAEFKIAK